MSLHPMGWDSFGLPAEQYAIRTGTHPAMTTHNNIDNFREQTAIAWALATIGTGICHKRPNTTNGPNGFLRSSMKKGLPMKRR